MENLIFEEILLVGNKSFLLSSIFSKEDIEEINESVFTQDLYKKTNLLLLEEGSQDKQEGIGRLRTYLKYILRNGFYEYLADKDKRNNPLRDKWKKFITSEKHQKAVAKILGFDYDELKEMKLNPFELVGVSIKGNLVILHYKKTFFVKSAKIKGSKNFEIWNKTLKQARGVIFKLKELEAEDEFKKKHREVSHYYPNLIATAFEKFFNLNEKGIKETSFDEILKLSQKYDYLITEKWDGALGIIYLDENDEIKITTKGSLNNQTNELNQKILDNQLKSGKLNKKLLLDYMLKGYVFIVEIIAEHTLVHIPYSKEDLVLTGVFKIDLQKGKLEKEIFGKELVSLGKKIGFSLAYPKIKKGKEEFLKLLDDIKTRKFLKPADYKEGFVVTFFKDNQIIRRVKIKFYSYLLLMKKSKLNWEKIINAFLYSKQKDNFENLRFFVKGFTEFEELIPDLKRMINKIIDTIKKYKTTDKKEKPEKRQEFIKEIMNEVNKTQNEYKSFFSMRQEKDKETQKQNLVKKLYTLYNKLNEVENVDLDKLKNLL